MKKIISFLFVMVPTIMFAQTIGPKLSFEQTVELEKSKAELFNIAKNWFANPSKVTKRILVSDESTGEITGEFSFKFASSKHSFKGLRVIGPLTFTGSVFVKDGAYKYEFKNFEHKGNDNAPNGAISLWKITIDNFCPYKTIKGGKGWKNDVWYELKIKIDQNVKALISDLSTMMSAESQGTKW